MYHQNHSASPKKSIMAVQHHPSTVCTHAFPMQWLHTVGLSEGHTLNVSVLQAAAGTQTRGSTGFANRERTFTRFKNSIMRIYCTFIPRKTFFRCRLVTIPALHFEGPGFELLPWDRLQWLRYAAGQGRVKCRAVQWMKQAV